MCKFLKLPRRTYYNLTSKVNLSSKNDTIENEIISAFKESRNNYGARKIKVVVAQKGLIVSRRQIRKIMLKHCLISSYTNKKYSPLKEKYNQDNITNIVKQNFANRQQLEVIVSDLTYVKVNNR